MQWMIGWNEESAVYVYHNFPFVRRAVCSLAEAIENWIDKGCYEICSKHDMYWHKRKDGKLIGVCIFCHKTIG